MGKLVAALFIPMIPRAKQSVRFGANGAYQKESIVLQEGLIRNAFRSWAVASKFKPIGGAVYARVVFYLPQGKKNTKCFPTQRPDLDNLEKMLWDALNKEAFTDDANIVGKSVDKFWADHEPGYMIELFDMEREP